MEETYACVKKSAPTVFSVAPAKPIAVLFPNVEVGLLKDWSLKLLVCCVRGTEGSRSFSMPGYSFESKVASWTSEGRVGDLVKCVAEGKLP